MMHLSSPREVVISFHKWSLLTLSLIACELFDGPVGFSTEFSERV